MNCKVILAVIISFAVSSIDAASVQHPNICQICTEAVGLAKALQASSPLTNKDPALKQMLNAIPAFSKLRIAGGVENLNKFVQDLTHVVLNEKMTPQQICARVSMCPTVSERPLQGSPSSDLISALLAMPSTKSSNNGHLDKTLCDYCIVYLTTTKRLLSDKEAQQDVADYASVLCNAVSYIKSICIVWMGNYVPQLMQHYADGINPVNDCMNAPSCKPAGSEQRAMRLKSLVSTATNSRQRSNRLGESLCNYCLEFGALYKEFMSDPQSAGQLSHGMLDSCDVLTKLQDDCRAWIPAHMPAIIEMLATEIDARKICTAAAFCKPSGAMDRNSGRVLKRPDVKKDGLCSLCEMALAEARQMLLDDKSRASILKYIKDNFCTILAQDKDKCDLTVDTYGPIILELLARNLDPPEVCKIFGLCNPNDTAAVMPQAKAAVVGADKCAACKLAVRNASGPLMANTVIVQLVRDKLCGYAAERTKCERAFDSPSPPLRRLMEQTLVPEEFCGLVGQCKSELPSQYCALCQAGVKLLQNKVKTDNATRAHVLANCESWCEYVPPANRTDCRNFFEKHIIDIFLDLNAYRYCQEMTACPLDPTPEPPKSSSHQTGDLGWTFRAILQKVGRSAARFNGRDIPPVL